MRPCPLPRLFVPQPTETVRYGAGANGTALPTATDDPGVPGTALQDMDVAQLVPAVVDRPPARTRLYPVTVSLQNTDDSRFLAFMNTTVGPLFSVSLRVEGRRALMSVCV